MDNESFTHVACYQKTKIKKQGSLLASQITCPNGSMQLSYNEASFVLQTHLQVRRLGLIPWRVLPYVYLNENRKLTWPIATCTKRENKRKGKQRIIVCLCTKQKQRSKFIASPPMLHVYKDRCNNPTMRRALFATLHKPVWMS